jgi:hypothetical protein
MPLASEKLNAIIEKIEDPQLRSSILNELLAAHIESDEKQARQNKLELYKLEYEKCAERYENIYKAVWTNFSFMSLVAGGILAFGKDIVGLDVPGGRSLIVFFACMTLLFWFVSSFIPMNRYGYAAGDRLAQIEVTLNGIFSTNLCHFSDFSNRGRGGRVAARLGKVLSQPNAGSVLSVFAVLVSILAVFSAVIFFLKGLLDPIPYKTLRGTAYSVVGALLIVVIVQVLREFCRQIYRAMKSRPKTGILLLTARKGPDSAITVGTAQLTSLHDFDHIVGKSTSLVSLTALPVSEFRPGGAHRIMGLDNATSAGRVLTLNYDQVNNFVIAQDNLDRADDDRSKAQKIRDDQFAKLTD